ncbi:MAG: hypothetical protein PVH68_00960 [Armatimonadota bacterium]|jgi:hypothetical protein
MGRKDLKKRTDTFSGYFEAECPFLMDLPTRRACPPEVYKGYGWELVRNVRLLAACAHLDALARIMHDPARAIGRHRPPPDSTDH